MNNKKCVLEVDVFDNPIATMEKLSAHKRPILHRAFSIFLFREDKMLIQKRAITKYHSGGLWANACCSHPISQNIKEEAQNRLLEELGAQNCELKEIFSFVYFHQFEADLFEYEYDHVLVGKFNGEIKPNPDEVEETRWITFKELRNLIQNSPEIFAPWFKLCAPKVLDYLSL